jgi:polyisoprenoid-binding protein YceI
VRVTSDGDALAVRGRLTIRGITRDVTVPLTVSVDPERFEARGRFDVKRSEFEMNYQSFVNPVGDVVHVSFVFRGVRAAP